MTKSLATRNVSLSNPQPSWEMLVMVVLIGAVIWYLVKNKNGAAAAGQYLNEESWDVAYNNDGLPTKITIHRNATRT